MPSLSKFFIKDHRIGYLEWPAYLIDLYRVFPRGLFLVMSYFVAKVMLWYMYGILPVERTTEVSVFVGILGGAWVKALDYYMQRGVDWSKRMQINGGESGSITINAETK